MSSRGSFGERSCVVRIVSADMFGSFRDISVPASESSAWVMVFSHLVATTCAGPSILMSWR